MDRATTLSWSASLQQIDDDVSMGSQDLQTYHMSSQVEVLRAALTPHFETSAELDLEVVKQEVLKWYRVNRDRGFAGLEPDAPHAARLGLKMFESLGHIRASRKKVEDMQQQKDQKSKNVNTAVERAVNNVLTRNPHANHAEARAAVVSRLTGWMNDQLKDVYLMLHTAEHQMSRAEATVEADILAFVEVVQREHQQGQAARWDPDEVVKSMMQDVELQLKALDIGNGEGSGETGGTSSLDPDSKDGSKDSLRYFCRYYIRKSSNLGHVHTYTCIYTE